MYIKTNLTLDDIKLNLDLTSNPKPKLACKQPCQSNLTKKIWPQILHMIDRTNSNLISHQTDPKSNKTGKKKKKPIQSNPKLNQQTHKSDQIQ